MSEMTQSWLVLVPVKSTRVGKSRLALEPDLRTRLAGAMAVDTVTAVAAARSVVSVLVLADDPADSALFRGIDRVHVRQTGVSGLNEALREACEALARDPRRGARAVAALPADLPSLRAAELDAALDAAAGTPRAVVADRQGTGTTLLTAREAVLLDPHYGPGSFAAHRVSGAVALSVPPGSGLRCDVDVLADLAGVGGPRTREEAGDLANAVAPRREVG